MSITLEKIYEVGRITERNFYPPAGKKKRFQELKGLFSDVGKRIKKEKKTSVDLVREVRKV